LEAEMGSWKEGSLALFYPDEAFAYIRKGGRAAW